MNHFKASIPGFPTEIGAEIEFPDMAELLIMPMFNNIDAEELYKVGTWFHRMLLDKAPIRRSTKYVAVKTFVQFLYPEIGACDIKIDPKFRDEWHIDTDIEGRDVFWHIITSDCTSRTEFNIKPVELDLPHHDVRRYLNVNAAELGLEGRKIDPRRFVTFTNHIHRPAPPEKIEFRFFFRVQETDFKVPEPLDKARMLTQDSKNYRGSTVHLNGNNIPNFEHVPGQIRIHYPMGRMYK